MHHGGASRVRGWIVVVACAAAAAWPRCALAAVAVTEDIPIPGGTAAMARAVGIEAAPDRARFLAELVRIVYDTAEGKNVEADARVAKLTAHLAVVDRFETALAAVQPAGAGVSLTLATVKTDRGRLKDFLDLVGFKLREKKKVFSVERTNNKEAAERNRLLRDLGIDLARLSTQLNAGETVRIEVPIDTVPVALTAKNWSDTIFQRAVPARGLFAAIMSDRRAALLAHGLAALDDETLTYLGETPAILARIYDHDAAAFAAFGDALRIHNGRVVPPGGADGIRVWEAALDEKVDRPDRFIRELFGTAHGRTAHLYASLAQLDAPRIAFVVGSWLPDPNGRVKQFKAVISAQNGRDDWDVSLRPFARPAADISLLLTRVRVLASGAPAAPAARLFWRRAFDGADLPDNPDRSLRNVEEDGPIDAGWLADAVVAADATVRNDRLNQLAFGQRAFAAAGAADLSNALIAVRALLRYQMLMLTLDRMGVRNPAIYAAAAHQADRIMSLDGRRRYLALAQYQGSVTLVARMVRVHRVTPAAGEALVNSLSAIPFNDDGAFAGAVGRWIERTLAPAMAIGPIAPDADIDVELTRAVAGPAGEETPPRRVEWEGRTYRVDVAAAEERRLTRAREKFRAPPVRAAVDVEHVAAALAKGSLTLADLKPAAAEVRRVAATLTPPDKKNPTPIPPGVDPAKNPIEILNRAAQDLAKITQAKDVKRAARVAEHLVPVADELLANALMSWAYALDIGVPEGTILNGGDVGRRHDFGFAEAVTETRQRRPWAEPAQVMSTGTPWHISGSLLGLDVAMASLALRRIDTGELPAPPTLSGPDRGTFMKTVALMNVYDLTDASRDSIVAAIRGGRKRVAALGADWQDATARVRMDGWRRRAVQWALERDAALVPSLFSLRELVELGEPPQALALDAWGAASDASDACLCTQAPLGLATLLVGRPQFGLVATQVVDVNLHIAEVLSDAGLPAALARGVLAAAMQDYIDQVRPIHVNDWLTLVRTAQAIPRERIEDYVAALTADGSLAPERPADRPQPQVRR